MSNRKHASPQEHITQQFFWNLLEFLMVDILVAMFFEGPSWAFLVLFSAESIALIASLTRDDKLMQEIQRPYEAIGQTAEVIGKADLTAEDLRQLAATLDDINVKSLNGRLQISSKGELAALTNAINGMLERIDKGYQAQARFVSDASHELRTPISVIQGYVAMLNRWGKDDPAVRQEAIDAIQKETAYMSGLVQQLLFLARGDNETQVVNKTDFCLSELAEETFRDMVLLDTGRVLDCDIAPDVFVHADSGMIKQCLRILLDNACKYTPVGGSVTLRLSAVGNRAEISVSDTGCGIPPEEQELVFRRFYRADASRNRETGGTGLGLAIGKWIAQHHGGDLTLHSVVGLGSRFTLSLPRLEL